MRSRKIRTSTSNAQPLGMLLALPVLVVAAAVLVYFWQRARMPEDAPLARMYRTEADLAVLVKAVDAYRESETTYPPPGPEGLAIAVEYLSRNTAFFPEGPPRDAWGRQFMYHPDRSAAERVGASPEAPYVLYSVGSDGQPGTVDDITNWLSNRPWRTVYEARQRAYGANSGSSHNDD